MILELPKSDMRGVQVSDKTKNGPLFKARVFLPVIHNIRFDLAEPTGIGLDAEPRWKSALRRLHAGRAPCRQRCTPRLRPGTFPAWCLYRPPCMNGCLELFRIGRLRFPS